MNTSVDTILKRARHIADMAGWSKTRLSREADLGINGLVDLPKPEFNPTAETLRKIELTVDRIVKEQNIEFPFEVKEAFAGAVASGGGAAMSIPVSNQTASIPDS